LQSITKVRGQAVLSVWYNVPVVDFALEHVATCSWLMYACAGHTGLSPAEMTAALNKDEHLKHSWVKVCVCRAIHTHAPTHTHTPTQTRTDKTHKYMYTHGHVWPLMYACLHLPLHRILWIWYQSARMHSIRTAVHRP